MAAGSRIDSSFGPAVKIEFAEINARRDALAEGRTGADDVAVLVVQLLDVEVHRADGERGAPEAREPHRQRAGVLRERVERRRAVGEDGERERGPVERECAYEAQGMDEELGEGYRDQDEENDVD